MMHLILPGMKERKKGCIINIASRYVAIGMSDVLITELELLRDHCQYTTTPAKRH